MIDFNKPVSTAESGALLRIPGWICAVVSLFVYPFIFGVIGVVLGIISTRDGSRTGSVLITASMVCMAIGILLKPF